MYVHIDFNYKNKFRIAAGPQVSFLQKTLQNYHGPWVWNLLLSYQTLYEWRKTIFLVGCFYIYIFL